MRRLVFDLDGTLTIDTPGVAYPEKEPNSAVVAALRDYHKKGFEIVISTARNMRTHAGNTGRITKHTVPVIVEWLAQHDIPYDELHIGKPWCGNEGFYIDDKAIRPDEFVRLSHDEIKLLLGIAS